MKTKSSITTPFWAKTMAVLLTVMLAIAALPVTQAYAASCTFTSTGTGNWGTNSTWTIAGAGCPASGSAYPGSTAGNSDAVIISAGHTVTLNVSPTNTISSVTLNGGTTTAVNISGSNSLTISGAITINRPSNGGTGTVNVAAGTLSSGSVTLSGTNGGRTTQIQISTGTANISGDISPAGGDSIVLFSGTGTLNVGGAFISGGTLTAPTGTVNYNGTDAQSIGAYTYNNLTISGSGNKSTSGNVSIGGNLDVGSGTTFTVTANNQLNVSGTTSVSGTLTLAGTGAKTFTGNVTVNSGGTWNETGAASINYAGNLQNDGAVTASTGAHTFSGAGKTISGANAIAIPSLTINGTTTNNGTLTISTTLAGGSTLTNGASGTLNFGGGSITPALTASASGNTVNYTGAAQTVKATTYNNLILSGTAAKTISTGTAVSGNLSIASGGATASINNDVIVNVGSLTLGGLGRVNGTWGSTASSATNKNNTYFAATTGMLNVSSDTRATPNVTTWPSASGITYRQALSASSLSGGSASVSGGFTFDNPSFVPNAGTYSAPVTFTPTDLTSYKTVAGNVDVAVAKANPTLSVTNSPATFDGSGHAAVVSAGSVAGTVSNVLTGGAATQTNAGTYAVTANFTSSDPNYNDLTGASAGNFVISAKPITITPDDGQSKVYGDADPTFTYTHTALVGSDTISGALGRVAGSNVGPYAFTLGSLSASSNYSLSLAPGHTFAITPKSITITPDDGQSKVYGDADPTFAYSFDPALESGDSFSGVLGRDAGSDVGSYAFTIGSLSAGSNYSLSLALGHTFAITPKPVTVTANSGQTKVFGQSDPTFTYTSSDPSATFTGALSREAGEDVGPYAITQGSLLGTGNYTIGSFVSANFTITAKPITVTPDDGQSKVFGQSDPTLTYTHTALVGSDTITGALGRDPGEDVGSYAFTLGTLTASSNYSLSLDPGHTFAITVKSITVTPDDGQSKVYGATDPSFTYTSSDPAAVFSGALGRAAGENVGPYAFTLGSLSAGSNYSLSLDPGHTFAITQAPLSITANNDSKVFDGLPYSGGNDVVYSGFVNSENSSVLGGTLTFSGSSQGAINANSYVITPGGLSSSNYNITFHDGTLTITAKPITVTPDDGQSKVYGATDPTFTYTFNPALVGGDSFSGALGRAAGENVGPYAFTLSSLSAGSNYSLSLDPGHTFGITPKTITVTVNAGQSKAFGDADPIFTYTSSDLTATFTGILARAAGENVGPYAINQGTLAAGANWTISSFVPDNFQITAKGITVTADDKSKTVGDADPAFTFTASGFVGSDTFTTPPTCGVSALHNVPGTYDITCSGAAVGPNYSLNPYVTGTLTVNPVNSAPTDIALSHSNVNENQPIGTVVGSFSTTDPDTGDTFTYSLVTDAVHCPSATDNASFTVSGSNLQTAAVFDYEVKTSYSICVRSTDAGSLSVTKPFTVSVNNLVDPIGSSFADVPTNYWSWSYIEAIYAAGITGGCGTNPLIYCPTSPVTRAQMAVFLLKGVHGSNYVPPAVGSSTGFSDVATSYWAAAWIKQLAAEGITGGCGAGIYCPENSVTRDQMAVFLLKAKHGTSYVPPAVGSDTGFTDVATSYWAAAWIKQLAAEGITGGCGTGTYCPTSPVTRDQMAVFLQRVFSLPRP